MTPQKKHARERASPSDSGSSSDPNVVAIIQARMGSTRLPGKVLKPLGNRTVLEHVVSRARRVDLIDTLCVATSDRRMDDAIVREGARLRVPVFRGAEADVLDRLYAAAAEFEADIVLRLTADCPFLDSEETRRVINHLLHSARLDYVGIGRTYPEGYGAEAFRFDTLEVAWREATAAADREHVTSFIWRNPERFRIARLELPVDLSEFRLTLDEPADYTKLKKVFSALAARNPNFGVHRATTYLRLHPAIAGINQRSSRSATR